MYLKEGKVPINIKRVDKNIKHEQISKTISLKSETYKPITENLEDNKTKETRADIPKATGNNHFLNLYSLFLESINISTKTGVISGIKYIVRELIRYRMFPKKNNWMSIFKISITV